MLEIELSSCGAASSSPTITIPISQTTRLAKHKKQAYSCKNIKIANRAYSTLTLHHAPRPPAPPKYNTVQYGIPAPTNAHPPPPRLQKSHLPFILFKLTLRTTTRPYNNYIHAEPRLHYRAARPTAFKHIVTLRPTPELGTIITAVIGAY